MSTGITVSDSATADFLAFKRASNNDKYIIFKIVGKEIVTHSTSSDAEYDHFFELFTDNEAQYAVYKMNYTTEDGREASKLVSIMWTPDSLPPRVKMVYAGSKGAFTSSMTGISVKVEASDKSDITEEIVIERCKKI